MIESLSNREIIRLAEEANRGGDYEAARHLLDREMLRRGLSILALHTIDTPAADPENYDNLDTPYNIVRGED